MTWHAYAIGSIDFGWDCLDTIADAMIRVDHGGDLKKGLAYMAQLADQFSAAQRSARRVGWDGNFVNKARVFWLPDVDNARFVCGFVWKQYEGGVCFVVSPYEIPALEIMSHTYMRVE